MKRLTISIPSPCTENWENMTQLEQGKHCAACNKVVIDFTKMTQPQLIQYLLENKGKKICGNFYNTQISSPITYLQKHKTTQWPAIAAMLVAGMFQLNNHVWSQKTQGQVKIHSTSIANEKNTDTQKNTEPANDSLITYTIQVMGEKDKKNLEGISVFIDSLGSFTTNKEGEVKLQLDPNKIPKTIVMQFSGINHESKKLTFAKNKLIHTKRMEIYLKEIDYERFMLKGDVSIDYNGH